MLHVFNRKRKLIDSELSMTQKNIVSVLLSVCCLCVFVGEMNKGKNYFMLQFHVMVVVKKLNFKCHIYNPLDIFLLLNNLMMFLNQ